MEQTIKYIALAAQLAELALKVGADAMPFILRIKAAAAENAAQPTEADFEALAAAEKPFRDKLNDTSNDDAAGDGAGQGEI